jgi:hypothetical protein
MVRAQPFGRIEEEIPLDVRFLLAFTIEEPW